MLNISDAYKNAIVLPMREFDLMVLINDEVVDKRFIKFIKIDEVSCSDDCIGIGDVCSNAFELEMFIPDSSISLNDAKVVIKSDLKLIDGIVEWVDLGTFIVDEVSRQKYTIKLSGFDAMKRFDQLYQPNIVFDSNTKFIDVLNDLISQCKVSLAMIDLNDYQDIVIDHYFENMSCKELLGYLAGLMGCNVRINRFNELEFYWYSDCGFSIDESMIYQDSYQMYLNDEYVVTSLTSGDEDNTLVCGSGNGISFANPYMTQVLLDKIFEKVNGFRYTSCSLKYRGNPGIENKDVITYLDKKIVVMKQSLSFDGGFSSEIESLAKAPESLVMKTSSPTEIKLNKLYHKLNDAFKYSSETILGHHGGNYVIDLNEDGLPCGWTIMDTPTLEPYTKLWKMSQGGLGFSEDGGKTFKNIAFDLEGNFNANIINTGIITGEMFELDLQTGVIKIGKRDQEGNISNPSFYLNELGELKISAFERLQEEVEIKKYLVSIENDGTKLTKEDDVITLKAKVYDGNNDETANISEICFNWYRISNEDDITWNENHQGMKILSLGSDDVNISANFYCEIILPIGTRKTAAITISDETDVANLANSYLDVTGVTLIQLYDNDTYLPDWSKQNAKITPAISNGSKHVNLSDCNISYKKIVNEQVIDLGEGEVVNNGILTITKNILTITIPNVTYVCYVNYKNTDIKLYVTFSLNIKGNDGISIVSRSIYYAIGSSNTVPPVNGWTIATLQRPANQYLWSKEVTRFSDGTTSESNPIMISGDRGDDGTIHSDIEPDDKTKLWFDTTTNLLKYYNGETWEVSNDFAQDINTMKQQVTSEYSSAIQQLKESLTTLVEELQTTTTDNTTIIEELSSQIIQNATSISLITKDVNVINNNLTGVAIKEEIEKWARFENGILELGVSNSPFVVKLSNTELGFYQSGTRIAYLSNQQLNIDFAIVMTKLNIGRFSFEYDEIEGLTLC